MATDKQERLVSIITPCREVDLPLVSKLLNSLKQQTIGFEKAEWILVVHNSGSDYLQQVEDMVKPYANIRLYKLQNEFHTPSSPKNYAMDRARGMYITFLDADDALAVDCLEEAASYFTDDLDGVFFQYQTVHDKEEIRLEINLGKPIGNSKVQYMQCGSCDHDLMQGAELTVTGKLYRRKVLEEHNIRFDTEVPIAEDVLFNLHFLRYGRKFCFLRDYVGYIYYLRADSAIQDFSGKTPEAVMRAGSGFLRVMKYALESGLFIDNILLDLIGYQSAMMLGCTELTLVQRRELKAGYAPYIARLKGVQPSGRYDGKLLKTIRLLPKLVILRPRLMHTVCAILRFLHVDMNAKIRKLHQG